MIDPNELRLGNFVEYNGKPAIVNSIAKNYIGIYLEKNEVWQTGTQDQIAPIPLTDEILLKCGFSDKEYKTGYTGVDFTNSSGITLDFVLTKPLFIGEFQKYFAFDLPDFRFIEVMYLHQLQNLFYAVNGQELKIKI